MVNDYQAPLFPPLPSLSSASSWGSMGDLRDNELSSMDDSPSVNEVNVTDKKEKTKTSDKDVPVGTRHVVRVIENTASNISNESKQRIESIESMESYASNESDEIHSNKVVCNEIERMDHASQSILTDKVIHWCEEGPLSVNPSSGSVSGFGSLVHKRSLVDPSSERGARTKKVAKASSHKARKPSSSTPSLRPTLPGAAKHVDLPSSVSVVPSGSRPR